MSETTIDPKIQAQLQATEHVVRALTPLDSGARSRVVVHVCQLLDIPVGSPSTIIPSSAAQPANPSIITPLQSSTPGRFSDIRSLKDSKAPKTHIEMACLVAYYLKEHAPTEERRTEISTADIEKYFNQAGFALPKHPRMVLPSAKNAGYFDTAERGNYKLNPVGFNLAAYGLSSKSGDSAKQGKK